MRPVRVRLLGGLVIALLSTVVTAAAVEIFAAIALRYRTPAPLFTGDMVTTALNRLPSNPAPLVSDWDLLWRNQPGAERTQSINPFPSDRMPTWTVRIDGRGFRGSERSERDEAPIYRIVCLGDSTTYGFNVDQDREYPRRLESLLRRHAPGQRIEVVNTGVPGWTWVQGAAFLRTGGLALRPDLVIAAFGTNDQFWSATATDREHLQRLQRPGVRVLESLREMLAPSHAFQLALSLAPSLTPAVSRACAAQIAELGVCRRVPLPEIADAVAEIARRTADDGRDLLIANLDYLETPAVTAARPAAARAGIPFLDLVREVKRRVAALDAARARRLALRLPGSVPGSAAPDAPRTVLFRLATGRATSVSVSVWAPPDTERARVELPLFDDATHGDERANDGVFSAAIPVRKDAVGIFYMFARDGVPEFLVRPPLQNPSAYRSYTIGAGPWIAPVDVFGTGTLMAERTHPDTRGHRVIAARLARAVVSTPSFRRFMRSRTAH